MDEKIVKWLFDILLAGSEIQDFLEQYKIESAIDYSQNLILKKAIERNLEIIGEAVNRIVRRDNAFLDTLPESRSIIGLRNIIIHAYDGISDEMIWSVVIQHLPVLLKQVDQILEN
ncbi:DUF86 domain-containing protein [Belliella sp. DSM 107340]|uniref:DUF86 domain-containing protein n=1 Tax=Belliella calami TaxID=2923436 RepID=A0ABS9UJ70_9BACT|nr:HepT-like ribonuclease domain-containing protein [Belliella calami]MCH7396666.1 DUF86 domain-containing protein [Belliella calami]